MTVHRIGKPYQFPPDLPSNDRGEGVRSRAAARQLDWIRLPEIKSKKEGGPAAAADATHAGALGVAPLAIAAARRGLIEGLHWTQDDRGRVELASAGVDALCAPPGPACGQKTGGGVGGA
jgi:hypothetical protein